MIYALVSIYTIIGINTLIFYLIDFRDEKFTFDRLIVSNIAFFLWPIFWLLRAIISAGFKL